MLLPCSSCSHLGISYVDMYEFSISEEMVRLHCFYGPALVSHHWENECASLPVTWDQTHPVLEVLGPCRKEAKANAILYTYASRLGLHLGAFTAHLVYGRCSLFRKPLRISSSIKRALVRVGDGMPRCVDNNVLIRTHVEVTPSCATR